MKTVRERRLDRLLLGRCPVTYNGELINTSLPSGNQTVLGRLFVVDQHPRSRSSMLKRYEVEDLQS